MVMTELSPFVWLKWQELGERARHQIKVPLPAPRPRRELGPENAKVGAATQQMPKPWEQGQ